MLRPLAIKSLKRFMTKIDELAGNADQNKFMDICLEAAVIALEKQRPDFAGDAGKDVAEDILDMDTVYKVLDICGGVKLNDPKLIAKAQEVLAEAKSG